MESNSLTGLLAGLSLGASLIIAIGAQNALVLKYGLLKKHVFALCCVCSLSDAILIALGVAGLGTLIKQVPEALMFVSIGGALFLFVYGALSFSRARSPKGMVMSDDNGASFRVAMSTCLALTFLNPHVYLDTVVLLGSISASYEGPARLAFAGGAMMASFIWFFALGYGARYLSKLFQKPIAWRLLDFSIGLVMWSIALSLIAEYIF